MNDKIVLSVEEIQVSIRRGMLELDLIFRPYAENIYPSLSIEKKELFVEFLAEEDMDLFAWIMQNKNVPAKYIKIIQEIKEEKNKSIGWS